MNRNKFALFLALLVASPLARAQTNAPAGYALNFNGFNNYASLTLAAPPASNYTLTAWVYLRTGGTVGGPRMAVLSASACNSSIEFLIRSATASATDPQYLELGRCSGFNGVPSTNPVPLNTWVHLAVTLSSNKTVSYFINGVPSGTYADTNAAHNYAFGTAVNLGDNSSSRRFDGMLDEVQLWNRALSPAEIWANRNRSLTGSETGLYAYYRFNEGSGATTADSAAAAGGSSGTLINGPTWATSGVPLLAPAQIAYAGAQLDLGPHWRSSAIVKPLDLDGDNVLGSDGYDVVNRSPVLPFYVGQAAILAGTYPGNGSYAVMDDPTNLASQFTSGTIDPFPGTGTNANLFQFTLNTNVLGRKVRVGLCVDNLDGTAYNASQLTLVQVYGNEASSGPVTTTSAAFNDRNPDWVFFDISGSTDGDVFLIQGAGGPYGAATLAGVVFDSMPNTLTVTNLSDTGPGSLRALLAVAPTGSAIAFATNLSGQTLTLTNGPLAPINTVIINAAALPRGLTLSGGGASQIFSVGSGVNLTLIGLTLSGGYAADAGGAIYSAPGSTLHLARCTLVGNSGLEGGAILNDGGLWMENCTLSGNSAAYGGGLQCRNLATLDHCTLCGNNAPNGGGGIYNKFTTLTVRDSIIANNSSSTSGADIYSQSAGLVLTNANLIQNLYLDSASTSNGPAPLTGLPLLATLGNYGGPTPTQPPLAGSPAIDAGGPTTLIVDQRGLPRMIGPAADLGAAEFYLTNGMVTTAADAGMGSLRYLLSQTLLGSPATLQFTPGLSGQTLLLTNGPLTLNDGLTLDASWLPAGLILNGNSNGCVFNLPAGTNGVTLISLTITNGSNAGIINAGWLSLFNCAIVGNSYSGAGGGIRNSGTLLLTGCVVSNNNAGFNGGGINNAGTGSAALTNCLIAGNHASGSGSGGGLINFGSMTLYNCILASNSVPGGAGGGALASAGPLWMGGCTCCGNYATVQAGALDIERVAWLQNCTFAGNVSPGGAGAILNNYDNGAQLTLLQCTVAGNSSSGGGGGGIWNSTTTLVVTNSIIAGNTAAAGSGADLGYDTSGTIIAGGSNLVPTFDYVGGRIVGAATLIAGAARLAPLGNYGGSTPTMPPLAGSPAIDAGSDAAVADLATDQRGYPRLTGAHVDLGAVEVSPNTVVTTVADSGPGSLRNCLASLPVPDLVSFATNLSGQVIVLTGGPLIPATNVAVDASALTQGIQVNGNAHSPILLIDLGVTATLNGLTLTNGYDATGGDAGGVANAGTLTLNNCTLAANGGADGAGAVYNEGVLMINHSLLTGNWAGFGDGAAIYNEGVLTVANSTLAGNLLTNGNGGGIWNDGSLRVVNSTFGGNAASYAGSLGGNPARAGRGGAIWNGGSLLVASSTLSGNDATVSGGGLEVDAGQAFLTNTIVAGNSAGTGTNIAGTFGGAYNFTSGNPLLGPLGNYGGPTPTLPPLPGSPVLDAGSDAAAAGLATDQRGWLRVVGAHVDIGAVEFQVSPVVTTTNDFGPGSLRLATTYTPSNSVITFDPSLSGRTLRLTNGQLNLRYNLTLDGSALASQFQIDGNSNSTLFLVSSGVTATLEALTLTNGFNTGVSPGAILNLGALTVSDCLLAGNTAVREAGAIDNEGTLTINRSTLFGNRAQLGNGGAIYNLGQLMLNNSTLAGNTSSGGTGGGALWNRGTASAALNNCTIASNTATANGGGILSDSTATLNITNCLLTGNQAAAWPDVFGFLNGEANLVGPTGLAPLGNYGGRTPTMPPLATTLAVDLGIDAVTNFLATDQRGLPRRAGAHVDIGAVEFQVANPPLFLNGAAGMVNSVSGTPAFQLAFTNLVYGNFTVFAATNVTLPFNAWTNLGPAVEVPPGSGQYQFSDPQATNSPQRFYRLRSP